MPPRDGQDSGSVADLDWDWIKGLSEVSGPLEGSEDADRLWPILEDLDASEAEGDHLQWVFQAARRLLRHQRDLGAKKDKEAKRKNREMEKRIKQLEKRSAGEVDEETALEDLRRTEEDLKSAEREIQELERTLELERVQKEENEGKIKRIKDENSQLKREVDGLKEAIGSMSATGNDSEAEESRDEARRAKVLEDEVRMKNKHIHHLIQDIEETEREMALYQDKVVELKDQLATATKEINGMASAYNQTQEMAQGFNDLVESLQSENARLRSLLEEYHAEKKQWELKETEIKDELEKRVQDSVKIVEEKEATIEELSSRLSQSASGKRKFSGDYSGSDDPQNASILSKALLEREEQIEKLKDELSRAASDLTMSSDIITKLRGPKDNQADPLQQMLLQVRGELFRAEERIKDLDEDVKEAQDVAKDKTEELMDTVVKMRAYEKGEYGLEHALDELKMFKKQLKLRDKQIRELTQLTNELQHRSGQIQEENLELREQLGLGPRKSAKTDDEKSIEYQYRTPPYKALMQVMQKDIERLEEERIHLKCENRKLARQLGHKAADLMLDPDDLKAVQEYATALRQRRFGLESSFEDVFKTHQDIMDAQRSVDSYKDKINELEHEALETKTKYDELMEENDNLRKSLQEILESVRSQDGQSDVRIQSESLEQVISMLDAKHLWGNYHPAMGLKAKIERLEGMNTELRDQLRKARIDEEKALVQVEKIRQVNDDMAGKLDQLEARGVCLIEDLGQRNSLEGRRRSVVPINSSPGASLLSGVQPETSGKLNSHLLQVLNQLKLKEELNKTLEGGVSKLHRQVGVVRHQMGLLYEEYHEKKSEWRREKKDQDAQSEVLQERIESSTTKISEYEKQLEIIRKGGGEAQERFADTARSIVLLKSNEAIMIRRYKALEESEDIHRKECFRLREDMVKMENGIIEKMGALQRFKDMASFKIEALQRQLAESTPSAHLDAANREFADLTAKYRDLLQKQKEQTIHERQNQELELNISNLRREKEDLVRELQASREKILSLESVIKTLGSDGNVLGIEQEIENLAKQIATLEMKEMNERQKAQHADSQLRLAKSQGHELEKRLEEVEVKFSDVTRVNMELQRTERELRNQVLTSIPEEQYNELKKRAETLEASENELKIEQDKLREVSEIARNQIQLFENKKEGENLELTALRHEVLDLQTQTDEKVLVGKLHRQIIALQMKENEYLQRNQTMESKISRLESYLFRLNRKADEKEDLAIQVRSQCYIKARALTKVIQDLRRQFSGSIPLAKQEKITRAILEMNEDKTKMHASLKEAEVKALEAETKVEELNIKMEGVDELVATLKRGPRTNQVLEWQHKLEELRLRDLRSRRMAEEWKHQVDFLSQANHSQSVRLEQMEEEVVRLENLMEQRQLDWESKEVELEALEDLGSSKASSEPASIGPVEIPNPDMPLAKQLEQSLSSLRRYQAIAEDYKGKLGDSRKIVEDVQKELRGVEAQVIAKDRIINDLRLQVPASVERAVAVASVTASSGMSFNQDYESRQALNIAQSTVSSLRQRLAQKEETLSRYENVLKETREEHTEELKRRFEEIVALQISIRNQSQAFNELRSASMLNASLSANQPTTGVIAQQAARINELEEEVKELQASLTELSNQLASARSEGDKNLRIANTRKKELEEIKENAGIERQMIKHQTKQEADRLRSEVNVFKQENLMLKDDIGNLKEAQSKAPSAIMKSLVEKLRNDLADKEKKQRAMARAITDLKQELVEGATSTSMSDKSKVAGNQSEVDVLQKKLDDMALQNERLQKQMSGLRSKETSLQNQLKALKDELAKKSNALMRLKENTPTNVKSKGPEKESEAELKATIRGLEDKLRALNQAERPLEDEQNGDRALKNVEEVARWDEKKKWEHKVEGLKKKVLHSEEELAKMVKANHSLKEIVTRLEREKLCLEQKLKVSTKSGSNRATLEALIKDNTVLEDEVKRLKHHELMNEQQGLETMKLRNKFLQERIEAQERKITALELGKKVGGSSSALMKQIEIIQEREKECQKTKIKLEEDNLKMKLKLAELTTPRLKDAQDKLAVLILQHTDNEEIKRKLVDIRDVLGSQETAAEKLPEKLRSTKSGKELKTLLEEVQKLKNINEQLLKRINERDDRIEALEKSGPSPKVVEVVQDDEKLINVEYVRQIEADLKRKTDLLSEVKVLLKNAADRERKQLCDLEDMKHRMKIILEIDPKTPSEILAKELRQTRLTVERLQCEKREMEHKLRNSGGIT